MTHRGDSNLARWVIPGIAGAFLLAIAGLSPGCKDEDVKLQPHEPITSPPPGPALFINVGDPCFNYGNENSSTFAGHKVSEETFVGEYAPCDPGVCLINHFQGRVSCPLGQAAPAPCAGPSDASCEGGRACVAADMVGPSCDSTATDGGSSQCASGKCNEWRNTCVCTTDAQCPQGAACDPQSRQCAHFVCHEPGDCQSSGATDAENQGKPCCDVGSYAPVTVAVCGQCEHGSGRSAEEAAYCSCRCGPVDGEPADGSAYCDCPGGFECTQIPPDAGLGDPGLAGKYCIKQGTAFTDASQCGSVIGHFEQGCDGTPAN